MRAVLVANRGEIACRILATVRRLGLRGIAVYSDEDAQAAHVATADEAHWLGDARAYLDAERIVAVARAAGADAIHPGYGFLAEDAAFAGAVSAAGVGWIGPPPEAIAAMGDKIAAKRAAERAGVPVVPGVHEPGLDDAGLRKAAGEVGFPLLVKAAAGGGGRGMRVVDDPDALETGVFDDAVAAARREASAAFGSDALLLERLIERPRHIEVQVLADRDGGVAAVGDRECSLQRRHQKIVEEAPAPGLDATRAAMADAAVAVARACGYEGAGTVEFVRSGVDGAWYFLEMNTRLQVEHPVTELVTGVDLVAWQLWIVEGARIDPALDRPEPRGHAVEARVTAEDPAHGFLPTGGRITGLVWPEAASGRAPHEIVSGRAPHEVVSGRAPHEAGPDGVRVDAGVRAGDVVSTAYDSLLGKVIAHGATREQALDRLDRALAGTRILGVETSVGYLRRLLAHPRVRAGDLDTGLLAAAPELAAQPLDSGALVAASLGRLATLERAAGGDPFGADGWRVGVPAPIRWRAHSGDRVVDVAVRGSTRDASVVLDEAPAHRARLVEACEFAGVGARELLAEVDGRARRYGFHADDDEVWIELDGAAWRVSWVGELAAARGDEGGEAVGPLLAPMPGTVTAVRAEAGAVVGRGDPVVVVEAMKMEHAVPAPVDGVVAELRVRNGDHVAMGQVLAVVEPREEAG
ncbi:biotin/lipoyl-binding protein [Egibacter rhizosphaerae]|uniref:biotin carboxylase n=1 Tax=Egibacter rhizosphaerae TaxID=1670831 RepID=A0A411YLG1_9ACTN|nr:biotin/lipoyl-binding protein [Egibacter rhizosphaerae]